MDGGISGRQVVRGKAEDVSDDELEQVVIEQVKCAIEQHPELAVAAARDVGWRVEPVGVGGCQ